jgi:DNA-binding NarL/FixJ family response regulator
MLRILIADDHAMVRRGLRNMLEQHDGWQVCAEAATGREAIAMATKHRPDVAVLDMAMPDLNGLEATRGIRIESPATAILVFTMIESTRLIRDVLVAGARGYLLKSDLDRHVMDAVATLASHRPYLGGAVGNEILAGYLRDAATTPDAELLTPRERETIQMIAEGLSSKQIALKLNISLKTVETHRTSLMRKIGAHTVADVVRYAIKNDISSV